MSIIDRMKHLKDQGRPFAAATVVRADSSTPRKVGASMLVLADGKQMGTIGGGEVERRVGLAAVEMLEGSLETRLLDYSLGDAERMTGHGGHGAGEPTEDTGAICGGSMSVFVQCYYPYDRLVLAGGGHVALAIHNIVRNMDLGLTVVDNRGEFASAERFPGAEVLLGEYSDVFTTIPLEIPTYVVIITHGHRWDGDVLEALGGRDWQQVRYVGMIGSRSKVGSCLRSAAGSGVSPDKLRRVHTPIGLDIGAETPEEIAVAIMAEIISVRRGRDPAAIGSMTIAKDVLGSV